LILSFEAKMNTPITDQQTRIISRLFSYELIIGLPGLAIAYVLLSPEVSKAVIMAFVIFWLPNKIFSLRVFKWVGAKYAKQVARSFYLAESSKFGSTLLLFALSFKMLQPINAGWLLSLYLGFFVVHQIALFGILQREAVKKPQ
jgi:ATP synthase protein I